MTSGTPPDSIPQLSVNTDTGRATPGGMADHVEDRAVYAMAERYLATAGRLIPGIDGAIHVAYDPKLVVQAGSAPRFLAIAALDERFAQVMAEMTGRQVGDDDFILVMGPGFVYYDMDDAHMAEIVAADLTTAIHRLHPVQCQGPIAAMMPWLVQIAGNIVIPGWDSDSEPDLEILSERKDKAIGRAIRGFIDQNYRGHVNADGQAVTDFPALSPVAEIVGNEACFYLSRSGGTPVSRQSMVRSIHEVIASAMRNAGISVIPKGLAGSFG